MLLEISRKGLEKRPSDPVATALATTARFDTGVAGLKASVDTHRPFSERFGLPPRTAALSLLS